MNKPEEKAATLRKKVISIFSFVLLVLVAVEIGIVWLFGSRGSFEPGWWHQVFGALMTIGGIFLAGWSIYIQYTLGKGTPSPKVATQQLITTGPYAVTRNPMTLGAFLLYLGIAIGMGSIPVILLVLVIFTALLTFIYRHETRELTERFGEEYLEYRKRTPFFIPGIR
ncbi:MAG: isoprenylcysteine carboxylmethyltransferase family protein, partial [Anaerolineaceae bacterium]|nr:isoprenylcysteine carboxylmethyltransferase family protein [Anaerolineaceae bacterium]